MERAAQPDLRITNCRLLTPSWRIEPGEIRLRGGRIVRAGAAGAPGEAGAAAGGGAAGGGAAGGGAAGRGGETVLDAGGRIAAPGFIDLHVHGGAGHDVLDGDPAGLAEIARACARHGVTGFLGTCVYKPGGDNPHLDAVRETAAACAAGSPPAGGAALLGLHLEGPFIAPEKRGMIQPDCLALPTREEVGRLLERAGAALRLMTIAPELPGAHEAIAALVNRGIVPSFGHSGADYAQTARGIRVGIRHATHLFNAMLPLRHREPGPVPALLEAEEVTVQLIFDGAHVHPSVLRLAARLLGPERLVLISDATRAMGLPDGSYVYDGLPFESRDGTAWYRDGTLIGTAMGLSRMVERAVRLGGLSLPDALRAASATPAAVLGLSARKGSLEPGKDADLVLLDPDLSVWKTIRSGEIVFG